MPAPPTSPEQRAQRIRLHADAVILELDTSSPEQMYQVVLDDLRFQINDGVLALLRFLSIARSSAEVTEFLRGIAPDEEPVRLSERLTRELQARSILVEVDADGREIRADASRRPPRKHPLLLHRRLFRERQILPLTRRLQHAFHAAVAAPLIAFVVASHAAFFVMDQVMSNRAIGSHASLGPSEWTLLVLVIYLSIFFHELGHCSACVCYGIRHGEIGVGIYFIYPVLYADVAQSWNLSRLRRAIVDCAGIYFQLIMGSIGCLLWIWTGKPFWRIFVYSTLLSAAFNMNPFLRLDGYWLLADMTGVPSLYRASDEILTYTFRSLVRRKSVAERPDTLRRPRWVAAFLALYCVGTVWFFAYFFMKIASVIAPRTITGLAKNTALIWTHIVALDMSADLLQLVVASLFLAVAGFGMSRFLLRAGRGLWTSTPGRWARTAVGAQVVPLARGWVRSDPAGGSDLVRWPHRPQPTRVDRFDESIRKNEDGV